MTRAEKFKEINSRTGGLLKSEMDISVLQVIGYLKYLKNKGILEDGQLKTTDYGDNVIALCGEFDWKPSNEEIMSSCIAICGDDAMEISMLVMMLRDHREMADEVINKIKEKNESDGSTESDGEASSS